MFFFTLFIAFLSVQGTFCEESLSDKDVLSGGQPQDSSTHPRQRRHKSAQHASREHARSTGGRQRPQKQPSTVVGDANSTSLNGSSNTPAVLPSPATENSTSTCIRNSTSAGAVNVGISDIVNTTPDDSGDVTDRICVSFGFLPDGGDAGGQRQTMASINSAIGQNAAAYGWYAQATSGTTFDGSQLLAVISDVKACNCVFQPAVMPVKGWKGLTSSDNSQAVAIAQVMKKFTDQGIPVWLRFAHEMNYYQTDGTYDGTASDFKAGWAAVSAACKSIAPEVKMWWTPNVASAANYAEYAPDDMSTVDLVGIDYYPKSLSSGTEFVDNMKAFHDKYAVDGRKFAIGETGLGYAGSVDDRISWFSQVTSANAQLTNYIAASWFNYQKGYDFEIVSFATPSVTSAFKSFLGK